MSSRKRNNRQHDITKYSIINSHEESNRLISVELMDQKLNALEDDNEDPGDTSSISTSSSLDMNHIHRQYSLPSTQKQYAQTLKQIMEQELEEPEFELMMDDIIRTLISIAYEEDRATDTNAAIQYLENCTVQDAMLSIGNIDEKLATDFTDSFTERHENAAMEIMLKICIKILNMRKLISDYPMIFVPLSFHLYQPRFMTKKTERKHKRNKQRRRRQLSRMSQTNITAALSAAHEAEDSLSALSGEAHHDDSHDMSDPQMIQKTYSLPIQPTNPRKLTKRPASAKRAKTQNRMRFQKTRSGLSLVLLPLPKRSSRHFHDQSTVFKHRLSDVSKEQIHTVRTMMSAKSSMQDIDEDEDDIGGGTAAHHVRMTSDASNSSTSHVTREDKKAMECARLRKWTEAFVFKKVENGVMKKEVLICEGCQTEIKLRDVAVVSKYEAGETHTQFLFHDLYCETLRKYKEAIRQYAFEYEFAALYGTMPCDVRDPDRYIHLFAMKDDLLVVDSTLSRNANTEDKRPHKPSSSSLENIVSDAGLRRERRLALLNLYKKHDKELSEFAAAELPELLRYIDVWTFGRPLWYFCVDQLSTKDRVPLWCILEFLATELGTSMAINLLRCTRDALVRFHVEALDNVCLAMIASSSYPIATSLYLAAFMQSNAIGDSARAHHFNDISTKYIAVATDLLSAIESDHLLAILIEIPSNIDDLSILDIVLRFKLERFLEFHRLQPIFMNMYAEYSYLSPSKPFRNSEADSLDILSLCYGDSALFYYCPVGAFTLHCTMYVVHVVLVSLITSQLLYPYKAIHLYEWMVWVFNAGFVLYEISELTIRKLFGYFQYWTNVVGFICAINWCILAVIRFHTYYDNFDYYECNGDDEACYRNAPLTKLYMILWSIQVILLWCRMAALLQRNKHAGPLLRMIMNMMLEICSFALLLFLFVVGFVLAVFYVVGGDVPPSDEAGGGLNRISSVFLYSIQALLAAQEWGVIVSNEDNEFDSDRSIIVQTLMVLLSIFGTLLLMNLFIALLTITYESEKQNARLKTNFARITHTIELNNRSSVMPPPLNIVVFALTLIYALFECITVLCTCGHWTTKLQELYPIQYSLQTELQSKEETEDESTIEVEKNHVRCGCFVRRGNYKIGNDRYCRHCRHSLRTKGDIDRYFELFKHYQLLDEDDKDLLRIRLSGRNICRHCFRSYKLKRHGLNRCQVLLELLSYYVFKCAIWWWLLPILAVPALIRKIYIRLHYNYSQDLHSNDTNEFYQAQTESNAKLKLEVAQVIQFHNKKKNSENNNDFKHAMKAIKALQEQMNKKLLDKKEEEEEDIDDDLLITPRIVSHARTHAPTSPIKNAISDLNLIHRLLPKDKSSQL
eukprot:115652_1